MYQVHQYFIELSFNLIYMFQEFENFIWYHSQVHLWSNLLNRNSIKSCQSVQVFVIFLTKSNSLSLFRSIWTEAHFQMICSICLINFLFEIFNDFFLNDFWCIFLQNVNKCHLQKFPSERIHVATSFMSVRKSNGYRIES